MAEADEVLRRLEAEAEGCYTWSDPPRAVYAAHRHPYRKVLYCLVGSIRFDLPETGASHELRPSERLELPPGTLHSATVGPHGVTCAEGRARSRPGPGG